MVLWGSVMLMTHPAHAADPKLRSEASSMEKQMDLNDLEVSFQPERWLKESTRPVW